jgi:hypothetical protein
MSQTAFSSRGAWSTRGVARSPRADEAGGLYHVLNLANFGARSFARKVSLWPSRKSFTERYDSTRSLIGLIESTNLLPIGN